MTKRLHDTLVICTRNRRQDLETCLKSLVALSGKPQEVLVVDSSTNSETEELVKALVSSGTVPNLNIVRSDQKGLVSARNVALDYLRNRTDIVHFVDDDVEFCQGYFEELMLQFATEPHLAGTGGVTLGAPNPRRNLVLDFFGLTSKTPGKLMSTGVASPTFVETENTLAVDWLPGCSMSFRLESVGERRFDLNRTDLPLGEDVDFTARLAMVGRLTHNHKAKLFHNLSPVNRDIEREMYRQDVIHRWTLAEQCIGRVTKMGVVSGTVSLAAIQFLAALLRLSISNLSNGIYALIGLFQVLRWGGLSENKKRYRR